MKYRTILSLLFISLKIEITIQITENKNFIFMTLTNILHLYYNTTQHKMFSIDEKIGKY